VYLLSSNENIQVAIRHNKFYLVSLYKNAIATNCIILQQSGYIISISQKNLSAHKAIATNPNINATANKNFVLLIIVKLKDT